MKLDISPLPEIAQSLIKLKAKRYGRGLAMRRLRGVVGTEDLIQAGAVGALLAYRQFDPADPGFAARLESSIAAQVRKAADTANPAGRKFERRHAVRGERVELTAKIPAPGIEDDGPCGQADRLAIEGLPRVQRDVVERRIWGGMTWGEIARDLGISRHAAQERYKTAARRLQKAAVA